MNKRRQLRMSKTDTVINRCSTRVLWKGKQYVRDVPMLFLSYVHDHKNATTTLDRWQWVVCMVCFHHTEYRCEFWNEIHDENKHDTLKCLYQAKKLSRHVDK